MNQFLFLLFLASLSGGFSVVLLIEAIRLRRKSATLETTIEGIRRDLQRVEYDASFRQSVIFDLRAAKLQARRKTEDLQAIASVHGEAIGRLAMEARATLTRLQAFEDSTFSIVRTPPENRPERVDARAAEAAAV